VKCGFFEVKVPSCHKEEAGMPLLFANGLLLLLLLLLLLSIGVAGCGGAGVDSAA